MRTISMQGDEEVLKDEYTVCISSRLFCLLQVFYLQVVFDHLLLLHYSLSLSLQISQGRN